VGHELERLHPGSVRLLASSETMAARTELGLGRFTTDDRDCAALTYLARQGAGRQQAEESAAAWWRYSQVVARLEGLWRAWEHLRQDPATGANVCWAEHAGHHMPTLLSPDGPFARAKDLDSTSSRGARTVASSSPVRSWPRCFHHFVTHERTPNRGTNAHVDQFAIASNSKARWGSPERGGTHTSGGIG
jgi:hypothetical protein